ncbi:MAG: pentapeptide repeat-containing protein [Cyanobacteria bacterium J06598_3]
MALVKAQEVLSRYAAGDRTFCNANLRGANFSGQDLSGADFSGADIRSATFDDAQLQSVSFAGAQAGLQRRWIAVHVVVTVLVAAFAGLLQGFVGIVATVLFDGSPEALLAESIYVLLLITVYVAISLQGFTLSACGTVLGSFLLVVAVAVGSAGSFSQDFAIAVASGISVAVVGVLAVVAVVLMMGAFSVSGIDSFIFALAIAAIMALSVAGAVVFFGADTFTFVVALALGLASWLLVLYIGWQVSRGHAKYTMVRELGLVFSALGGTSFCGADLTGATFRKARLINTNLTDSTQGKTRLTHVCWEGTESLNRSRLGTTLLQDNRVRRILTIPEKGYKQDLSYADLQGANLEGVTLEGASLKRAVLTNAKLENAVLKNATLTRVQALGADFTGACLTGAILEAWDIDSTTTFKDVDCQYIFLKENPNGYGRSERRPRDPNAVFEQGDLERLLREMSAS